MKLLFIMQEESSRKNQELRNYKTINSKIRRASKTFTDVESNSTGLIK